MIELYFTFIFTIPLSYDQMSHRFSSVIQHVSQLKKATQATRVLTRAYVVRSRTSNGCLNTRKILTRKESLIQVLVVVQIAA